LVNNISNMAWLCCGSIVPFCPGGAEGSVFVPASTLDVMEAHHDLGKFVAELPVAQRRGVLSSGREACRRADQGRTTAQGGAVPAASGSPCGAGSGKEFTNVGRLTLGAGIESSTAMGSDLWAAEALQEAETEVGVAVMIDRGVRAACGCRQRYRSADPSTDLGLTA
jgi:hypothetical protein